MKTTTRISSNCLSNYRRVARWMRQTAIDVIALCLSCSLCVPILLLPVAGSQSGTDAYLDEVRRATEDGRFAKYLLAICCYALVLEFVLRTVQKWISRWLSPLQLVTVMAVLYGVTHLRFHWLGFVYATAVGAVTARYFTRNPRILSFMIWHGVWELIAVAYVLLRLSRGIKGLH